MIEYDRNFIPVCVPGDASVIHLVDVKDLVRNNLLSPERIGEWATICTLEKDWTLTLDIPDDFEVCPVCDDSTSVVVEVFNLKGKIADWDLHREGPHGEGCSCPHDDNYTSANDHDEFLLNMEASTWLAYGMSKGFVSSPRCDTDHEEEGKDAPCHPFVWVIRP